MFDFIFGKKKEDKSSYQDEDDISIKSTPTEKEETKAPIITKAFFFTISVRYIDKDNTESTYHWTSDGFFDYRKAEEKAKNIIKDIHEGLKIISNSDFIFIIDLTLKKEKFISATTSNVRVATFADGVCVSEKSIMVVDGENVILQKLPENTYNIVRN